MPEAREKNPAPVLFSFLLIKLFRPHKLIRPY
jgi:hypothetical protein